MDTSAREQTRRGGGFNGRAPKSSFVAANTPKYALWLKDNVSIVLPRSTGLRRGLDVFDEFVA